MPRAPFAQRACAGLGRRHAAIERTGDDTGTRRETGAGSSRSLENPGTTLRYSNQQHLSSASLHLTAFCTRRRPAPILGRPNFSAPKALCEPLCATQQRPTRSHVNQRRHGAAAGRVATGSGGLEHAAAAASVALFAQARAVGRGAAAAAAAGSAGCCASSIQLAAGRRRPSKRRRVCFTAPRPAPPSGRLAAAASSIFLQPGSSTTALTPAVLWPAAAAASAVSAGTTSTGVVPFCCAQAGVAGAFWQCRHGRWRGQWQHTRQHGTGGGGRPAGAAAAQRRA